MAIMKFRNGRNYLTLSVPRTSIVELSRLPGIEYFDDAVKFSHDVWDEQLAYIAAHAITKQPFYTGSLSRRNATSRRGQFKPTKKHLQTINEKHSERTLTMDEVFIFERFPANNIMSRWPGFIFTPALLQEMARNATEGRSRLLDHNNGLPLGSTIFGEVQETTIRGLQGTFLRTVEYIPRNEATGPLIDFVETGVYKYCSVGLSLGSAVDLIEIEDDEGNSFTAIRVDYDPTEQFSAELDEISFVYLGRLYGVGSGKNSAKDIEKPGDRIKETIITISQEGKKESGDGLLINAKGSLIEGSEGAGQEDVPEGQTEPAGLKNAPAGNPAIEGSSENKNQEPKESEDGVAPGQDADPFPSDSETMKYSFAINGVDFEFEVEDNAEGKKIRQSIERLIENAEGAVEKTFSKKVEALEESVATLTDTLAAECVRMTQAMYDGDDDFDQKAEEKFFKELPAERLRTQYAQIKKQHARNSYNPATKNGIRPSGQGQFSNGRQQFNLAYGQKPSAEAV